MPAEPPVPNTDFADQGRSCHRQGDWLWLPLRRAWKNVAQAPEEVVRQEWIRRLTHEGGYQLGKLGQELRAMHGHGSPRADVVAWKSVEHRSAGQSPGIVIETKAGEGPVLLEDFQQGESYARAVQAEFLVMARPSIAAVYQLQAGLPGEAREVNSWPAAAYWSDARAMRRLRESLRAFDREEFQKLLTDCHDLLRSNHAMAPDQAFDTISKVLFIKLYVEQSGRVGTFTTDYLDRRELDRLGAEAPVHD